MKGMRKWLSVGGLLCLMIGCAMVQNLWAADRPKDYPGKPIVLMVGFSPGGSSDIGARVLGESLKKVIGQPIVVENKPGAGTQIMLTDFKNNARPDGYTMGALIMNGLMPGPLLFKQHAPFV